MADRFGHTPRNQPRTEDAAPETAFDDREGISAGARTLVIHPFLKGSEDDRDPDAGLEEACGLAEAIGLDIGSSELVPLPNIRPSAYIGPGKVEELADRIELLKVELVVVDATLSPVQQRNLERALKAKVIDRTGLILEIFGERARTREGELQVELAHLSYQKSRLVRSWTHLERQRGGVGFMGGPGERQIEADRRILSERISRLKKDLDAVKRTRKLHRDSRQKVPYQVVALVGYTNAGKSTLFNRLTSSDVFAEDLLFATLDPTMRGITLRSGRRVILSDTVGFISDLPTHLVAAFRATLEEVVEADIILHVRDASDPQSEEHRRDVLGILKELGAGESADVPVIEVLNKIDLLPPEEREALRLKAQRDNGVVALSALGGEGAEALLDSLEAVFAAKEQVVQVTVPHAEGATLAWLYEHGDVLARQDREDGAHLQVRLSAADIGKFSKQTDIDLVEKI